MGFLTSIDMYGKPVQFLYHKDSYFATGCGICVSVFVYLIIIAYIVLYIIDYARFDYQTVVSEPENLQDPPTYTFRVTDSPTDYSNKDTHFLQLLFGFKLKDNPSKWLTQNEITNLGLNLHIRYAANGNESELEYEPCTAPSELGGSFKDYEFSGTFCLKNKNFTLGGDRTSYQTAKFLTIAVGMNPSVFNQNGVNFYYIYTNYLLDERDVDEPLIPYYDWKIYELSSGIQTLAYSYFQVSKLSSYTKILPKAMIGKGKKRYYSYFDQAKYAILPNEVENNEILKIYALSSDVINKRSRIYNNLFAMMGIIGGFAQIVIIVGGIIASCRANKTLEESLVDDFYALIDPANNVYIDEKYEDFLKGILDEKIYPGEKSDPKKAAQLQALREFFKEDAEKYKRNDKHYNQKDYLAKKIIYRFAKTYIFSGMKFSWDESCINCLCCCEACKPERVRNKNKILNKALKKMNNETDFVSILKTLSIFDGLKQSFLKKETQLSIFKALANKSYSSVKDPETDQKKNEKEPKQEIIDEFKSEDKKSVSTKRTMKRNEQIKGNILTTETLHELFKAIKKMSLHTDPNEQKLDEKLTKTFVGKDYEDEVDEYLNLAQEDLKKKKSKSKKQGKNGDADNQNNPQRNPNEDRAYTGAQLDEITRAFDN